ncbi:MAG: glycosyltransferase family 2 protein [Bdellovibrionota bacterium]
MSVFLSIVVPVYNEEESILLCYEKLVQVFSVYEKTVEFIFIDDGSRDKSYSILKNLSVKDSRVKCIQFSRNFGKEAAMSAGFDFCSGEYVCQIDADLQDPPELIPEMIALAQQKELDVVYGVRTKRDGETRLKKITSFLFYKLIARISSIDIPEHTGDFRVMTKEVVMAIRKLKETQRFMKGLFAWVGFKQEGFYYERNSRSAGKTKFNYVKLWNFAIEGITSFTNVPLKLATYVGFFFACFSFCLAVFYILKYFLYGDRFQGFLTLIVAILFIGGIQIMFLGIIGEYLGRIYFESKNRPLYLVKNKVIDTSASKID